MNVSTKATAHRQAERRSIRRSTTMNLRSTAFSDGEPMPDRYTADGDNHSPPLVFEFIPPETRTLALTLEDADTGFAHWIMFDMDPKIHGLAQAEIAGRYRDGVNGLGDLGYTGPHATEERSYVFKLYALDTRLGLANGIDLPRLRGALEGHILAEARLMTRYRCHAKVPAAPFTRAQDARAPQGVPTP